MSGGLELWRRLGSGNLDPSGVDARWVHQRRVSHWQPDSRRRPMASCSMEWTSAAWWKSAGSEQPVSEGVGCHAVGIVLLNEFISCMDRLVQMNEQEVICNYYSQRRVSTHMRQCCSNCTSADGCSITLIAINSMQICIHVGLTDSSTQDQSGDPPSWALLTPS